MDYARFEELRRRDCDEFEAALQAARSRRPGSQGKSYENLEDLAVRYRQILHDHSLAEARYPGTSIARRLKRLALAGTHFLQRDSGRNLPSLGRFITEIFPRAIQGMVPLIAVTTGLFFLTGVFGFALASTEPALGSIFLSPDMIQGLERGTLWTESIFSVTPGSVASTKIATNNLSVAMTAWAGGTLAGLGAFYVILLNGLMLGIVMATTARYSMAGELLEFVAAHGPLEISMILVTAAAGLSVGKALVVASDRPRPELIRESARDALVVLLGCLPWILLLGFVEGFLSPSPYLAPMFKAAIGFLLWILFIFMAAQPVSKT